jgi:fermentation-respiration switch protein FrsA (DUF1100 family)
LTDVAEQIWDFQLPNRMPVCGMAAWTPRRWRKFVLGTLILVPAAYFMLRWFENHQVYVPHTTLETTGRELGRPFEEVTFQAGDQTQLHAWFFPAPANSPRGQLVALFCHGNAGNISHRLKYYDTLLQTGLNVFAFDYRGYGRSKGKPGEEGTYLDALAACQWLVQKGFLSTNIIAYGESLGGAVATELALRQALGGVVLQSTFTSIPDIGAEVFPWLPVRWIATIRYDTRNKLSRLTIPALIMHSRSDRFIRFHHAERNFAAAREPKLFWEIAGDHNEQPDANPEQFREGIEKFLTLIETVRRARPGATGL